MSGTNSLLVVSSVFCTNSWDPKCRERQTAYFRALNENSDKSTGQRIFRILRFPRDGSSEIADSKELVSAEESLEDMDYYLFP